MAILAGLVRPEELVDGLCPETFETADFLNVQVSEVTE